MVLEPVVDSITLFDDHYDIKLPSGETIRTTPEGIIESIVEGGKTMNYEVGDQFVIEIESIYKDRIRTKCPISQILEIYIFFECLIIEFTLVGDLM